MKINGWLNTERSASHVYLPAWIFNDFAGMSQDASPLRYVRYDRSRENEYVAAMRQLISKDLSEPYSIYVYRYFLYQWGDLCFLAMDEKDEMVGVVVSKLEPHRGGPLRGYIAMLAVREEYRGRGIATKLVRMAIDAMTERDADEIVLETEMTNTPAMKIYERLGFIRSKRLHRYYLNGSSAYRLVLYLKEGVGSIQTGFDPLAPHPGMAEPPSIAAGATHGSRDCSG
ncbi:Acetyltransferase GNAT family [Penicillium malachiteum]|nr:Acetyltransferase GNAT family [Penicillium malachiteum]